MPDGGERVVLAEDGDRGAVSGLDGRPERRLHPAHAPLDLEALTGQELRQPAGRLELLIAQLGIVVNAARQRFQLVGHAVDGGRDLLLESAHQLTPGVGMDSAGRSAVSTISPRNGVIGCAA